MLPIKADLNLSTIPQDIVRKIIRIDGVSFGRMRLISQTWNSLVDEHISKRKKLPALEYLSIYYAVKDKERIICVHLSISMQNKNYFDNWTNDWVVVPNSTEGFFGIVKGFSDHYWDQGRDSSEITRILLQFSRVFSLQIYLLNPKDFEIVGNSIRKDVSLEYLCIYAAEFSDFERYFVMEMLRKRSLSGLRICATSCNTDLLYKYLTFLPKYVGSFWLIQGNTHTTMPGMLFGKPTDFWRKIANAMINSGSFYETRKPVQSEKMLTHAEDYARLFRIV